VTPNPSSGIFKVVVFDGDGKYPCTAAVYDLTGKIIWSRKLIKPESISINLSEQPKGIYYIKVYSNDSFAVKKIVLY
jgi:hypothetical protein